MKTKTLLSITLLIGLLVSFQIPFVAAEDVDIIPAFTPSQDLNVDPIKLPKITEKILKNGLTVVYVPHNELPVVEARILFVSGTLYNPLDKPGLTNFMGNMLSKGTETRNAQQLAEEIEYVGGSLESSGGNNTSYAHVSVLKKDLELGLELLSDIIINPSFPQEEIDREKMQLMSDFMASKDNASQIASRQWRKYVYGEHPYGAPTNGTPESIETLERDELVSMYNKVIVPSNAYLIITGDITPKSAGKLVKKYFGKWSGNAKPEITVEQPVDGAGSEILIINKPDAVQTQIRAGYLIAPYNLGDDMYAFEVMDYLFASGGFSSRLMHRCRSELGLTYGIYGGLAPRIQRGAYTVSTSTKNDRTGEMIDEIYGIMNNCINDGFTEQELLDAKAYLTGSSPMGFETPAHLLSQIQSAILFDYGDPAAFYAKYRQGIADVTLDEINAMAKKYILPGKVRMVMVGVAEEIRPQVEKEGFTVKVIEIDEI